MDEVVVGIDAGGTTTRALATTVDGRRLGSGRAGPANPQAQPPARVAGALDAALRRALGDVPPPRVRAVVVGIAGYAGAGAPEVREAVDAVWTGASLDCPVRLVADAAVAFAAGTPAPAGVVVIAGTGAVAARIEADQVTRSVDGLGWLLGDEGSGFWLGRAAARWTARALAAGAAPTALSRAVTDQLGTADPERFVLRCYQQPQERLAGLAPVVCTAATGGDPTAAALVRQAAAHLAANLAALHDEPGPRVLAGGLLSNPTPVRDRLLALLAGEPARGVAIAGDGAAGAAWLAARAAGGAGGGGEAERHRRFTRRASD